MKIHLLLFLALLLTDPRDIAKVNDLKKEAEQAFLSGKYEQAKSIYHTLYDSMGIDEPTIHLNLAHSYFQLNDTAAAKTIYNRLSSSNDKKLKSIAYQQLGVMSKNANKLEESLQQLKSSIKADPTNQEARYNYEVVKKLLEEQKQQQQDQENQDQQQENQDEKQENQDQENQNGEGENQDQQEGQQDQKDQEGQQQDEGDEQKKGEEQKGEEQKEGQEKQEQEKTQEQMTKEKLKEMNISEEKAKMILEAMKGNEIQYLQQQRRKAKKRPPTDKPDW